MAEAAAQQPGHCVICGHAPLRAFGMAPDARDAIHVAQWECPACRLLTSHPPATPERVATYYAGDYYGRIWSDPEKVWRHNLAAYGTEMRLLDELTSPVAEKRRALDVGCGYGVLVHMLGERGYRALGCETGTAAVAFCRQRGLDVVRAVAPDLPFSDGTFQLVASFHVIEHVLDPQAFVTSLVRVLEPGGTLVIVTDHRWTVHYPLRRFVSRLRGRVPPFYTSTDHTFVFAPEHVAALMARAQCVDVRTIAFAHVPNGESLHWRAYRGAFRTLDRLLGWGDYMMIAGVKGPHG